MGIEIEVPIRISRKTTIVLTASFISEWPGNSLGEWFFTDQDYWMYCAERVEVFTYLLFVGFFSFGIDTEQKVSNCDAMNFLVANGSAHLSPKPTRKLFHFHRS